VKQGPEATAPGPYVTAIPAVVTVRSAIASSKKPTPTASPRVIKRRTAEPNASISASLFKSQKSLSVSPKPSLSTAPTSRPTASTVVSSSQNSLSGDVIFTLVNQHRATIGKPAFEKHSELCTLAAARAPQVYEELYVTKKLHAGFKALNLPYWATENIAAYQTEAESVRWWLSDYIHKKAIESDAKYSCAACSGRYCSQIFTSFIKK
jgi:uncharacterized protein YkwD